jgi:hypothetical protein
MTSTDEALEALKAFESKETAVGDAYLAIARQRKASVPTTVANVTTEVIERHEKGGCLFAPGTVDTLSAKFGADANVCDIFDKYVKELDELEIYCPREGKPDRRAEFGRA